MNLKKILILLGVIFSATMFFGAISIIKNLPQTPLNNNLSAYGSGDYDFTLEHDGLERFYVVHVPPEYDKNSSTPLFIALHGGGGNARSSPGYFGLNLKSDREGFIVVYPEGTGKKVLGKTFAVWNAGRCCGTALQDNVDDVGFIDSMIDKLKSDFNIDEKRVYATGMSNGAQMVYRLACELSDKIAAIAPSGSQGTFDNCHPERPVPVLHIQGKADPCSLYDGGVCGRCMADFWRKLGIPVQYNSWECISIPGYVDGWKTRNGCSGKTNVTFRNKGAICVTHEGCQQNADVTLCTVDGLGHNWPGQKTYGVEACKTNPDGIICNAWKDSVGPLSQDISANDMIWEFFKEHPMEW